MPVVDLSRIGLEGMETAQRNAESRQRVDTSHFETEVAKENHEKMQRLNDLAANSVTDILKGNRTPGDVSVPQIKSLADPLEAAGNVYMMGGAPELGADFLSRASTIRKQEDDINTAEYTRKGHALDNMKKGADFVASTVGVARTKEDWDAGWQAVEKSGLIPQEIVDLFKGLEFSPEAVELVNEQSLSAKERADLERLAQNQERMEADSESIRKHREIMARIADGRLKVAEDAQANATRIGTAATSPTAQDIKHTSAVIKELIFKGVEPTDASIKKAWTAGAMTIAATAKEMVRSNRSLSWEDAVSRAVLQSDAVGDWTPFVNVEKFLGLVETSRTPTGAKYKAKGKTPDEPLEFNVGVTQKADLVKGRFYSTPKGTARWNGEAFTTD